ncbi:MAG: hypothetical protein Q4B82_09270 [Alysiella sp.]|uniref:hypothetical protein n=1 Tax=Alysiella sp. TaxID=1872483 RepID=UPI0026DD0548|nr:hypothetical protein [Alysiella sp.]MDO4434749.1 hypothetical protein [Alysiella sp.]
MIELKVKFNDVWAAAFQAESINKQMKQDEIFDMVSSVKQHDNILILNTKFNNHEEARRIIMPLLIIAANSYGFDVCCIN